MTEYLKGDVMFLDLEDEMLSPLKSLKTYIDNSSAQNIKADIENLGADKFINKISETFKERDLKETYTFFKEVKKIQSEEDFSKIDKEDLLDLQYHLEYWRTLDIKVNTYGVYSQYMRPFYKDLVQMDKTLVDGKSTSHKFEIRFGVVGVMMDVLTMNKIERYITKDTGDSDKYSIRNFDSMYYRADTNESKTMKMNKIYPMTPFMDELPDDWLEKSIEFVTKINEKDNAEVVAIKRENMRRLKFHRAELHVNNYHINNERFEAMHISANSSDSQYKHRLTLSEKKELISKYSRGLLVNKLTNKMLVTIPPTMDSTVALCIWEMDYFRKQLGHGSTSIVRENRNRILKNEYKPGDFVLTSVGTISDVSEPVRNILPNLEEASFFRGVVIQNQGQAEHKTNKIQDETVRVRISQVANGRVDTILSDVDISYDELLGIPSQGSNIGEEKSYLIPRKIVDKSKLIIKANEVIEMLHPRVPSSSRFDFEISTIANPIHWNDNDIEKARKVIIEYENYEIDTDIKPAE